MIRKRKIQAFTIMELMIVMVVSSIVVAAGAKCFEIVQRQMHSIRQNMDIVEELNQLKYILERDAFKAREIRRNDRQLNFVGDTLTVEYQLSETQILRKHLGLTDTFRVAVSELGSRASRPYEAMLDTSLVEQVWFTGTTAGPKEKFLIHKSYAAETFLNWEEEPALGN